MTTNKIIKLKETIFENHYNDLKIKLEDVLSMCDSEIEELMLLQLYNYFQNFEKRVREDFSRFSEINFIEEELVLEDPDLPISINKKIQLESRIKKHNYRYDYGGYYKYIGFKVLENVSEGFTLEELETDPNLTIYDFIYREFHIYPQFETIVDNVNYRVDIAIILNRLQNGKIIDTRKIALECDGYDYHSSPEQKKNDDIRTRKLKLNGWKEVFRYSGSEIYQIKDMQVIHSNFEDIIKMLMI
jgi:hypothetical protein